MLIDLERVFLSESNSLKRRFCWRARRTHRTHSHAQLVVTHKEDGCCWRVAAGCNESTSSTYHYPLVLSTEELNVKVYMGAVRREAVAGYGKGKVCGRISKAPLVRVKVGQARPVLAPPTCRITFPSSSSTATTTVWNCCCCAGCGCCRCHCYCLYVRPCTCHTGVHVLSSLVTALCSNCESYIT